MVFGILATLALGVGSVFFVMQSLNEKRSVRVKVLDVIDESRVRVLEEGRECEVILAGIAYPPGDEKSISDGKWMIETVAKGFFFNMEILKEYQDTRYVTLYPLGGESVNQLMLRKGYARYSAMGLDFRKLCSRRRSTPKTIVLAFGTLKGSFSGMLPVR